MIFFNRYAIYRIHQRYLFSFCSQIEIVFKKCSVGSIESWKRINVGRIDAKRGGGGTIPGVRQVNMTDQILAPCYSKNIYLIQQ